ncbi:MAG: RNA-binding protein [Candidatus Riflebacteria bacterium]|jgi:RNA recognition motif-containing protein|nr:RNA-binding protein [Candidatus Riflebacteria bacterium]
MAVKLFVGNLPFSVDSAKLSEEFAKFGEVVSANIVIDKASKRSKGFGFIEFTTKEAAEAAISGMNEQEMGGRKLTVSMAKKQ